METARREPAASSQPGYEHCLPRHAPIRLHALLHCRSTARQRPFWWCCQPTRDFWCHAPAPLSEIPRPGPLLTHSGTNRGGKAGSAARRVGAPLSRLVDRETIDERLAHAAGRIDPGEPQLVAPGGLGCTGPAKSETLIMVFCGIKGPRLPGCFNRVLGATGHGSFHSDLGFLSSGWLHLTLSNARNR